MEFKLYKNKITNEVIEIIRDKKENTKECNCDDNCSCENCHCNDLVELIPNTTDGAREKHVPVYTINGDEIEVTIEHVMTEAHYIELIALVTENKVYKVYLKPNDEPKAKFPYIKNSKIYELCNLHDLWVKEVE